MRRRRNRAVWLGVVGLGIAFAATAPAFADAPAAVAPANQPAQTPLSSAQLHPGSQIRPTMKRRPGDMFSAPAAEDCALPADPALKFTLKSVRVDGAAGLSPAAVAASWSAFKDRSIVPADLCKIRDALAQSLFKHGLYARVLIPEQHVGADGVVTLSVIEAKVKVVRLHGDIGPVQGKVEAILEHLRALSPFNLDTAQRYLLLANEIPGVSADARLSRSTAPGAGPGDLDLDIDLSRTAYDVLGEVQNTNAKSLGPWSGIVRADFNSLTPFGERTSIVAYTSLGNYDQQVVQAIEQVHLGSNGVFAQAQFSFGHSHPGSDLRSLNLIGDSYVGTFEVDDPVIRLKRFSLTLAAGFDLVDQTETQAGTPLNDDTLRIFWTRASMNGRHEFANTLFGDYVTLTGDVSVDLRKGIHALGASATGAVNLSRAAGHSDAFVAREDGTVTLRFDPAGPGYPVVLTLHTQAQIADRALLAYEELPVGNLSIGRGYDPSSATGDDLLAGGLKGQIGPIPVGKFVRVAPYGFFDMAQADSLSPGTADVTLRSIGGGMEFFLPYHLHADVAYAHPLNKISPYALTQPPPRVLVQLSVQF